MVQRNDDISGTLYDIMCCGTVKCASCAHTQACYKHGRRSAFTHEHKKTAVTRGWEVVASLLFQIQRRATRVPRQQGILHCTECIYSQI